MPGSVTIGEVVALSRGQQTIDLAMVHPEAEALAKWEGFLTWSVVPVSFLPHGEAVPRSMTIEQLLASCEERPNCIVRLTP